MAILRYVGGAIALLGVLGGLCAWTAAFHSSSRMYADGRPTLRQRLTGVWYFDSRNLTDRGLQHRRTLVQSLLGFLACLAVAALGMALWLFAQ